MSVSYSIRRAVVCRGGGKKRAAVAVGAGYIANL